ncbi:DUF4236 domain-containing protein [Salisediminibacterium halotolerans]|uniref:DUF4236 domain-containing protein n=1 Tax=Salisediminibacterium halotolerans TaxID=517425 RepID=UPI000EAD14DE|nr:DUF4236 domain-containing protein [Salisediminibacterium halotolerans]RLJ78040.1 uncharacterized protein DUF4236 [Actinophytocola xinjiangensis]RPE88622.1 uncharacterized protein DUF4236 [Salisediminibacterium halotolerans]TWG37017.1 uncharacterized protein DUF4236 [Salisediminibacterium halotolerans]GEL08282.1 hypothetical protein SHA02_16980 [Salisediminibacterium halotolerans]
MSLRFRKRVKVAPGVRLNFSKRGISASAGPRGASVTAGKRGLYGNAGIPGTGLSYRSKLNSAPSGTKRSSVQQNSQTGKGSRPVQVEWNDNTRDVEFKQADGTPLNDEEIRSVRKAYKKQLTAIYQEKATEINERTNRLTRLHHELFDNQTDLDAKANEPLENMPEEPVYATIFKETADDEKRQLPLWKKALLFLPGPKKELKNLVEQKAEKKWQENLQTYNEETDLLNEEHSHREELLQQVLNGNAEAMEEWTAIFFDELDFPLETNVDYDILSAEHAAADIDLPNLDDIPNEEAEVLKSGKLKISEKTQRSRREDYAFLVGGSALYIASFFFAHLPTLKTITISGYNQRLDQSTGHHVDHYIYSLIIDREMLYSFHASQIHPIEAFTHFNPRLNATKTYIFKEIEPYEI